MEPMPYDRDPTLHDLLTGPLRNSITRALTSLLDGPWQIIDNKRQPVLPAEMISPLPTLRYALSLELEPLGFLATDAPAAIAQGASALMIALLKERWRYQMSADLHLEITVADYAELQQQHILLQASETRYRELAGQLEIRVAEQVSTIEKQQRSLFQAEKLASVGQLAAGVAHEINNPIGFVKSNLGAAQAYFADLQKILEQLRNKNPANNIHSASNVHPINNGHSLNNGRPANNKPDLETLWKDNDLDYLFQDANELFKESIEGVQRVAKIVAALKEFSAVDSLGLKQVDINEQIRNVCELAKMQVAAAGEINHQLNPLPRLSCQAGAINQALLNLIVNALQATRTGGKVLVTTQEDAGDICIHVKDTGVGIAPEVQPRLFEPFFTTRGVGEGTGLGLKICRDIAQAHDGSIDFTSVLGEGTQFTLRLPVKLRSPLPRNA